MAKRSPSHPGRILHVSKDDTPGIPRYADAMLRVRNATVDQEELTRVLNRLEELLLIPRARVPAILLDAIALWAAVNKVDLPLSEFTRTRLEDDDMAQRFLHWYWREIEKKRMTRTVAALGKKKRPASKK